MYILYELKYGHLLCVIVIFITKVLVGLMKYDKMNILTNT
jgi:hypothetical protein